MKQIRFNTFETNSSSTHSLIVCTEEDYIKLCNNELYILGEELVDFDEAKKSLLEDGYNVKDLSDIEIRDFISNSEDLWYGPFTLDRYIYEDEYLENYEKRFTTPNGETLVIFGKFGYDG